MRTAVPLLALLLAAPARGETVTASPFRFELPAGWLNLSRGAPPENFRGLPQAVIERARATAVTALDVAGAGDGFAENLNVVITRCPGRFDDALLEKIVAEAPRSIAREAPGASFQLVERGVTSIGGVNAGRLVYDLTLGAQKLRQLQLHLPSGRLCAIATYTATPETFARYLPIFEASARATGGLAEPPEEGFLARILRSAGRGALIGGIAGGLGALLFGLLRRRKRGAAKE
ncbi:MAG: hypothetical protein ACOY3Y_00090 [Acidobacteriota bacterium]